MNTTNQDVMETEKDTPYASGSRIKRRLRRIWFGPELYLQDRGTSIWFVWAALLVWAAYAALMMALGGRNPVYGSGWEQLNYVRWIQAPYDFVRFLPSSSYSRGSPFAWIFWVVWVSFALSLMLFSERVLHPGERPSRRSTLWHVFLWQLAGLLLVMMHNPRIPVWWSTSHTVIPILTLIAFQVATLIAWFAFPFLVYWLAIPIVLWNRMQDNRPHKQASSKSEQGPSAAVVPDCGEKRENAVRSTTRNLIARLSVVAAAVLCLALSIPRILTSAPAVSATGIWTRFPLDDSYVTCLVIDPVTPSTLYAVARLGLVRSTDGGNSWTHAKAGSTDSNISLLAIDPVTPSILYAGTVKNGILRSADGGKTWTTTGLTGKLATTPILSIAVDPVTPSILYASTGSGGWSGIYSRAPGPQTVYRSTDSGTTWTAVNSGLADEHSNPIEFYALAIDQVTPSTICALSGSGLFRSVDSGTTWNAMDTGLVDMSLCDLVIDPSDHDTMYVAASYDGILRSTDRGRTWIQIKMGRAYEGALSVAIDPANPTILYAGTDGGIYRYDTVASAK